MKLYLVIVHFIALNICAQMAVGYMQLVNSFKSFAGFFSPPDNISIFKTSEERKYTCEIGGVIVTMNYFHDECTLGNNT